MIKGKFSRINFTHAARKWAFTVKTTTGAPSGTLTGASGPGAGFVYNSADNTWYVYSVLQTGWEQIG